MEERVAAPVRRIDARAQVVPVADRMHRLVADDLFQDARRRRPVDAAQHEEAAVEPGREQVDEIVVDDREIVAVNDGVEELLAHAHQRRGAARREIEAPQQLKPARLRRAVDFGGGIVGRGLAPFGDRGFELLVVRPVAARQRLEEGDARAGLELAVARQDFARERHAGGFAAAGQQLDRRAGSDWRTAVARPRADRGCGRSARGRAPRWSAAYRQRRKCSRQPNLSPCPAN